MKYLLDTNTLGYMIRGVPEVVKRALLEDPSEYGISTITQVELMAGAALKNSPKLWDEVTDLLSDIQICNFDSAAAAEAAFVRAELRRIGKPNGDFDSLIAGHALSLGAILVTNNTKHFENVPGLVLDNWMH